MELQGEPEEKKKRHLLPNISDQQLDYTAQRGTD